ncbi:MAG: response regulator [Candidatus Taylorbacteria bacterium]|nr:response regulator [Candidatus Taylorbacteria bacterium]
MTISENKKILLITEDDASLRNVLKDDLEGDGFIVLEAENGVTGLKIALKEHPDLILLDILMPQMGGVEMLRGLRDANTWGKQVPVILLTNVSPDTEEMNKVITEHEPAYYLKKSEFALSDVVAKIKERLASPSSLLSRSDK